MLFLFIPTAILAGLFVVTDPFKVLRPFSLSYFNSTNRDYLSSELYILNNPEQQYDSFIFGSSRGGGINTYHWAKYLPEGSKPFLFQGWSETLTGIEQKISFIDEHSYGLKNAIILLDIPGSFAKNQLPTEALAIKDPDISGQPRWKHRMILFYDFIQKPSQWIRSVRECFDSSPPDISFDVITNDWNANNRSLDLSYPPEKDSLKNMSSMARAAFLKEIQDKTDSDLVESKPLIRGRFIEQLQHIKTIFDKNGTDYRILITPGYCYTSPSISSKDLFLLKQMFGNDKVFNFSGKNYLSSDYNNFSDSGHFGLYVGWYMIEECYRGSNADMESL